MKINRNWLILKMQYLLPEMIYEIMLFLPEKNIPNFAITCKKIYTAYKNIYFPMLRQRLTNTNIQPSLSECIGSRYITFTLLIDEFSTDDDMTTCLMSYKTMPTKYFKVLWKKLKSLDLNSARIVHIVKDMLHSNLICDLRNEDIVEMLVKEIDMKNHHYSKYWRALFYQVNTCRSFDSFAKHFGLDVIYDSDTFADFLSKLLLHRNTVLIRHILKSRGNFERLCLKYVNKWEAQSKKEIASIKRILPKESTYQTKSK